MKVDLTVLAIPAYLGAMGAEYTWLRRHPAPVGTRAGDYQFNDTVASLTMGVGSLLVPVATRRLLRSLTPGVGRWGRHALSLVVASTVATIVADVARARARSGRLPDAGVIADPTEHTGAPSQRITGALAAGAVLSTAVTAATVWTTRTSAERLFARHNRDLGTGLLAWAVVLLGWDFVYYWNHRLMHECRWLWAVHVVHHSSEHYNLSTALRQPVADGVTLNVPYGLLTLLGVRPSLIEQARALHLIYQFWIHTEVIRSIGWLERVLNTPSHHRVHHGSNQPYLDRNHGSILIVWDRLFGTFEPESQPPVYGLTSNIDTFNPLSIAFHEWRDIAQDIARAQTWRDRWSYLVRGPGWAYSRRA